MRFQVLINGKWNGGSYATKKLAEEEAARVLKLSPSAKVEVAPKGEPKPAAKK